eukprot:Hpha_TRINITY_DN4206_c0_g1::TRINITY_DN4206_c0_g1_i1::g.186572::m.186572
MQRSRGGSRGSKGGGDVDKRRLIRDGLEKRKREDAEVKGEEVMRERKEWEDQMLMTLEVLWMTILAILFSSSVTRDESWDWLSAIMLFIWNIVFYIFLFNHNWMDRAHFYLSNIALLTILPTVLEGWWEIPFLLSPLRWVFLFFSNLLLPVVYWRRFILRSHPSEIDRQVVYLFLTWEAANLGLLLLMGAAQRPPLSELN